ncbi:hypothetical protein ACOMHN_064155 [Nucella lapillus]
METVKASRRKQTKPNRNPFGMDPQSGSFNPASSRIAMLDEEESDSRSFEREQEMPREGGFKGETPYDSSQYERGNSGENGGLERDRDAFRDRGEEYDRERGTPIDSKERDREMPRDPGSSRHHRRSAEEGGGEVAPLDMSIVSCRMCPETFSTSSDLHAHMNSVHGTAPKRSRMDFDFPTAYHRLGSELLQENLPSSEGPPRHHHHQEEALSLTVPKPQEKQPPRDSEPPAGEQLGEGRSVKVNGGRIFHLDAYCQLCDREFCNKYFLKTHKAIRHGIADDSSLSTPSASEASQKSSPGGNFPPLPPKVELSPSPWRQQQELKKDHSKADSRQMSPTAKKSEADLAAEEKVFSVISAVKNSLQNSQSESSKSSSGGGGSGSSTKDPSMEDYCEFCQKHFCNKYYLKKHKQDVHGIIPETGPTTTKRSRPSSSLLDLPMPHSSMGSHMLLPQSMPGLGGMHSMPPGMMMLNPFMPQMTLLSAGNMPPPLLHAPPLHPPPHSQALSQSLPLPGAVPGLSPTTPTSQASEFSPNPDTFCSLCSKEFSTVYFLKIHKANKHGIHSEELPPEAKLLGEMVESNGILVHPRWPPFVDGKHEGSIKSSPPPLTSINQMVTCRLCDKDFPNAQAFKIHQVNEHGKNLEPALPDGYESSLPKSEPYLVSSSYRRMSGELPPAHGGGSAGPGDTMFGNMMVARLVDRVTCDICQKDLCNKYFLRVHKLKSHGIDMEEEANESSRERNANYDRYSPNDSSSRAQPLNMTMSPKQGPPAMVMPKPEARDYSSNGSKDFKMEKPGGGFKSFTDVPTFLSETINNEYLRRSTPQPLFKGFDYGMPGFPPSSSANMNHDQLLGDGIDPEAYCDICKKEFCSKYFLRTHKENIHGIKSEVPMPSRSRAKPGPKPSAPKMNSMSISGGGSNSLLAGLPIPSMPFPFPPGMMMRGSNGGGGGGGGSFGRSRDGFEKHHFRWKDPPTTNATARVTCDICHKELCNKYFLRTHKLKKHGIPPTDSTQSPMSDSPAQSEIDAASNQSSQPDNFLVDRGTGMALQRSEASSVPQSIPLPPSERSSSKPAEPVKASRSEDEKGLFPPSNHHHHLSSGNNNNDTVTCHLCERKFRNMQWLSAHVRKDHAEAFTPDLMDLRMLPPLGPSPHFGGDLEPIMCQVCRLLLPNEISLKLHLLQEHNAQINLQMDDGPASNNRQQKQQQQQQHHLSSFFSRIGGRRESVKTWRSKSRKHAERKTKMFVCSLGDYRTHWLYKLQRHEKKAHGIAGSKPKSAAEESGVNFLNEDAKQFKCGLCTSRFRSHTYCQMHLREAHIHMLKDFVSQKRRRSALNKLSCRYCSFSTSFPFRLHSHVSRYHHRLLAPAPPDPQEEKAFPDLTPVACSETPPESLHSSPDHSTLEEAGFERSASSGAQDLRKRPFSLEGREDGGTTPSVVSLSESFLSGSPVDSRVHQSLSASFRMSEFTP